MSPNAPSTDLSPVYLLPLLSHSDPPKHLPPAKAEPLTGRDEIACPRAIQAVAVTVPTAVSFEARLAGSFLDMAIEHVPKLQYSGLDRYNNLPVVTRLVIYYNNKYQKGHWMELESTAFSFHQKLPYGRLCQSNPGNRWGTQNHR
jgi:hypothetical protein